MSKPSSEDGAGRWLTIVGVWTIAAAMAGASVLVAVSAMRRDSAAQPVARPDPVLRARVTRGSVIDVVTAAVKAEPELEQDVMSPRSLGGELAVVTAAPKVPGATVDSGDLLVEIAERPVVVFSGEVPAFRDLTINAQGVDVEQLQRALANLGFGSGRDRAGVAGAGTWQAMRLFLSRRGLTPVDRAGAPLPPDQPDDQMVLPLGQVVFVRRLPATVEDGCTLGAAIAPTGRVCRLAGGSVRLVASLPAFEAERVKVGQKAEIVVPSRSPITASVEVVQPPSGSATVAESRNSGIGEESTPASRSAGSTEAVTVRLAPTPGNENVDVAVSGSARIVINRADDSLLVPVTALRETAGGRPWVQVLSGAGGRRVEVELNLCVEGRCAVRAAGDNLHVDDEVEVEVNPGR